MGPVALALGILCAMIVSAVPLVGGGLAFAGFMQVSLKALRRQPVEPKDGFVGFEAPLDHIVMGLLQIAGMLACCVGVYVSQAIFFPGSLLILDRQMTWTQAKDECMARIAPNWGAWTLFVVVVSLVASSGLLLVRRGRVLHRAHRPHRDGLRLQAHDGHGSGRRGLSRGRPSVPVPSARPACRPSGRPCGCRRAPA